MAGKLTVGEDLGMIKLIYRLVRLVGREMHLVTIVYRQRDSGSPEPAIIYLTPLLALAYFVFFGWFEARFVIYSELHRVELHQVGLCLIPIIIGAALATLASMPLAWSYSKADKQGKMPPPDRRWIPLIVKGTSCPSHCSGENGPEGTQEVSFLTCRRPPARIGDLMIESGG